MKNLFTIVAGIFLASPAIAQEPQDRLTVVELFTSQGCSSCPPADAALKTLRDRPGMLTLSWAVDYWDRLGWEDTFASPHNSMRQAAYNKRFGRGGVFTPQMVFDGRYQSVGSKQEDVRNAIAEAQASDRLTVLPSISLEGETIKLELPSTDVDDDIALVIVWYLGDATVEIGEGENQGRSLHYTNVVRLSEMLPDWDGSAITYDIDVTAGLEAGADHFAILMQQGYYHGPIVGSATIALDGTPGG